MALIPGSPGEISASWLSEVFGEQVDGVELLDAHAGTTGRAIIQLEGPGHLPARLFVKLPPEDEQQRLFVTSSGMGQREARFYAQLSGEVPLRVPRCYYADSNETGDQYIMLLENLDDSGCTFRNTTNHYSIDYVRQVLSAFARLHAGYWESNRFADDLNWVQPLLQHDIAVQLVGLALQRHRQEMPPVFTQMAEHYLANTDRVHSLWGAGAATLIHGDVHDGNLFMDSGEPGFLDWALLARGPGMRDVGYFLAGSLAVEHRPLARELIGEYREQLLAAGCAAPTLEQLWLQYRQHVAYVWVGAVTTLAMGDAWQPSAYVRSTLTRIHAVMESVGTVESLA
jgi:phosphotransferase family enzyme